ncbi:dihydropyrimidinase [Anaerotignum sp. MB30-C6]|uniref:dihydropyrimidinase n=1 Tax=Anaerotignum sp. MB30-C6 TaxID=3070814 RepID=UPI0027DD6321|nr:dihydropyrimidinase [Anaerotignum sp. MB30-C6]WMI82304.1 dihydropyrimidinase [Anaerotignum sp. MB30-C6]
MDLIIKNGTIVTEKEMFRGDIAVKDGIIAAIGTDLSNISCTNVVDATGKLVLPGAIDAHTHLAMPFGGTISADGYYAGTRAAACGGTTTVFDFALQDFDEKMIDVVKRRDALAAPEAAVDYAFHIGVKDVHGELLDSMKEAVEYGVPSFKVFMVYDFGVTDGVFYQVLEKAKEIGALICVHAENNEMVNTLVEKYISEGKGDAWHHYLSRPEFVEAEADSRAISWAKSLNAPLYIVHLANKQGVEYVTKAKEEGYPIYAETCPQYLNFTCDVYKREDGRNFVCSPPIKAQESQDAIWEAIKRGDIDTVATDHCPFQQSEKDWGKDDFRKIPNGCAGIENMYPYMLAKANEGKISFMKAVEVCSSNPARIFGCTQKGGLTVGKDADIVIYDPEKDFTVTCENMHSDYDHTIWEGTQLHGYPVKTFSRGRLVYEDGEFKGEPGWGKFIRRNLSQ